MGQRLVITYVKDQNPIMTSYHQQSGYTDSSLAIVSMLLEAFADEENRKDLPAIARTACNVFDGRWQSDENVKSSELHAGISKHDGEQEEIRNTIGLPECTAYFIGALDFTEEGMQKASSYAVAEAKIDLDELKALVPETFFVTDIRGLERIGHIKASVPIEEMPDDMDFNELLEQGFIKSNIEVKKLPAGINPSEYMDLQQVTELFEFVVDNMKKKCFDFYMENDTENNLIFTAME